MIAAAFGRRRWVATLVAIASVVIVLLVGAIVAWPRGTSLGVPVISTLLERDGPIFAVAIDRHGERVAYTEGNALLLLDLGMRVTREVDRGELYHNAELAFVDDDHVAVARAPNFLVGQALEIVSLSDGSRRTLRPQVAGIAVSHDGQRMAWGTEEGVFVSTRGTEDLRGVLRQPFVRPLGFSPDDKAVLVADHRNAALLAIDLEGTRQVREIRRGTDLRLVTGEVVAAWPAKDVFLISEQADQPASPLFVSILEEGREPRPILTLDERTLSGGGYAAGRWVVSASQRRNEVFIADLSRRPLELERIPFPTTYALPVAFLDDDRLIAWVMSAKGRQESFLYQLSTREVRPAAPRGRILSTHRGRGIFLELQPDGSNGLWEWSGDERDPAPVLVDGKAVTLPRGWRVHCPTRVSTPCVSVEDGDGYSRIHLVYPDEGWRFEELIRTLEPRARVSIDPSGKRIAITEAQGSRILELDTRHSRVVTPQGMVGDWVHVAWTADGDALIGTVLGLDGQGNGIVRLSLEGETEVLWRHDDQVVFEPVVSPGGDHLAVRVKRYRSDLMLLDFNDNARGR